MTFVMDVFKERTVLLIPKIIKVRARMSTIPQTSSFPLGPLRSNPLDSIAFYTGPPRAKALTLRSVQVLDYSRT
jgi:hypothetical protein